VVASIRKVTLIDFKLERSGGGGYSPSILDQTYLPALLRRQGVVLDYPNATLGVDGRADRDVEDSLLKSLNENSAAVVLGDPSTIWSQPVFDTVVRRIGEGVRLWVDLPSLRDIAWQLKQNYEYAHRYLDFLAFIGIALTNIDVITHVARYDNPKSFTLDRKDYAAGFRHPELFRGVDEVLFQRAHALRLHRDAQAVAAVPLRDFGELDVVDITTDLPYFAWNEPDVAVIAASYIGNAGGCVIASSGLVFRDAYRGATGHWFPGGEENERLLQNLVRTLNPPFLPGSGSSELDIHRIIQSIERNLLEFIEAVLGPKWPEHIDPRRREKAEKRKIAERSKIVWWAYLDLADHINTIGKSLAHFRGAITACGFPSSRKKFEAEVLRTGRLIELRILDSHMTKRVIMGHEFSSVDFMALKEVDQNIIRLCRAAANLKTVDRQSNEPAKP
jgi:hypothetical protein